MNQKGIAPILILVGILITAAIAGGAYYFSRPSTPPVQTSPVPQATPTDPTSSWKTYTNNKIGYQIMYPSDWNLREEDSSGELIMLSKGSSFIEIQNELTIILKQNQTFEEYILNTPGAGNGNSVQKIDINGNTSFLQEGKQNGGELASNSQIWIEHKNKYLSIIFKGFSYQEIKPILSTFKFLDSEQTENKSCKTDSDCALLTCSGCFNKVWIKTAPPDLACMRYENYSCKCVNNTCSETKSP